MLVLLHPSSNIEITKYFNYKSKFNVIFPRNNLPRIKYVSEKCVSDKSHDKRMTKEVKEHIGFHYLLTKIQLCTLILLELNIFHKKY